MSRVELAPEVVEDFERILEHLAAYEITEGAVRIQSIIEALAILEHHPRIGRPAEGDKRELVIGKDSRGYVALYRYVAEADTVLVLAIRSQSEAGYVRS